ncbi:DUF4197 domain-containing protein [Pleionea sp. CnH1-48]|uniref:DUF4197 domain-containing protein n=1 Tax=Pleionea sp. CnH1-48 TaxID=2954494 RepID=UPI002096C9A5|nr:DUF4197 domain-containing protein [Pleionea sp. CnH1-48]MCO7224908.1 DUF4197 domain-containing protein [Pleionea sp. CnH1-48]
MQKIILVSLMLVLAGCKTAQPYVEALGQIALENQVPSQQESTSAIKEALVKGAGSAVSSLGKEGGFSQSAFKIPLPENIQNITEKARKFGLGSYVDQFELSMNRSAEKALPHAMDVFKQAISQMSVSDVIGILQGPDNAATNYFKQTSTKALTNKFLPIVTDATSKVGVTKEYKKLSDKINGYGSMFGINMPENIDLDQYITSKATDALFVKMAEEEKLIRDNPIERTSYLLKKVFGYYSKQTP